VILNLTPHPIRLYNTGRADGSDDLDDGLLLTIPAEPTPARIATIDLGSTYERYESGDVRHRVPVELVEFGHTHDLPRRADGVLLIVSLVVALAQVPYGRSDLRVPYWEVRNSTGTVIGCRLLAQPC